MSREEGHEEGRKIGHLEILLSLAEEKFGPLDESLRKRRPGGADLSEANLSGASLSGMDLSKTELNKADLFEADIRSVCLGALEDALKLDAESDRMEECVRRISRTLRP